MKLWCASLLLLLAQACGLILPAASAHNLLETANPSPASAEHFLGFDLNVYPGDAAMATLREDFSFSGYWISPPPGETANTWMGKRAAMRQLGFGFLVLYRGREVREIHSEADGKGKGQSDAHEASANARREGFPPGTIVFLDVEEGGRLPEQYHAYLRAWADALLAAGYRPGVYCSAIAVNEGHGVTIVTADDIGANEAPREFAYWVYNDACPPAPGCAPKMVAPPPARSGITYAAVWQFAQSPRRKNLTGRCAATYARDGNCYAASDKAHAWFLDLNSATSADPSSGAR